MGTTRGSSRSHLAIDETVWASETVGEEAVLAEFADETTLAQPEPTPVMALAEAPRRGLRLLSPRTPMRDVVRTILVGCFSAMALGASFAIGFGYVWSDLSIVAPPAETESTAGAAPNGEGSQQPAPRVSAPASSATLSGAQTTAEPLAPAERPTGSAVSEPRAAAATAPEKVERTGSPPAAVEATDPGPAFGVPLERSIPGELALRDAGGSAPVTAGRGPLISQPMLSAESATIPEPVLPSSPSLSMSTGAARAAEVSEPIAVPTTVVHRSDLDAVREAIGRYQAAYSQKDIGGMALVWPSVDVAGVARAFENIDKQALTFADCRVTTAGNLATAVCPGQVRYVGRVGGRLQERHGTWTIALERNGDIWQFTRLNVR